MLVLYGYLKKNIDNFLILKKYFFRNMTEFDLDPYSTKILLN
jgi:hypothetical protein